MTHTIFYVHCDVCGSEFEAEDHPTYGPMVDGHLPDDESPEEGLVWNLAHLTLSGWECEDQVLIHPSAFNN